MERERQFRYIESPFNFNAPGVSKYPVEVTGNHLLQVMARRLGWHDLTGRKILDFGCGVRFAQTIVNLGLEPELYVGLDVNRESLAWLQQQALGERLIFEHVDVHNQMYNPAGSWDGPWPQLERFRAVPFDVICMFSVITHQNPEDAAGVFRLLRDIGGPKGRLYFTAFIDDTVETYSERDPQNPGLLSTYNPAFLREIALNAGWHFVASYPKSDLQQPTFLAEAI